MIAALYGVGLRPGDRYFCPSSPAWGHGLWHGTIAPLALGIHVMSYAGKFDVVRIFEALEEFQITNMAAAPTVFRMLKHSGGRERYRIHLEKISFTGEPMDADTFTYIERAFGVTPCSMYGTTEVGVLIVNFPGLQRGTRWHQAPRQGSSRLGGGHCRQRWPGPAAPSERRDRRQAQGPMVLRQGSWVLRRGRVFLSTRVALTTSLSRLAGR